MRKVRAFGLRILGLFDGRRSDDDFSAELESHIALHTDDGVRAGLTPEEARRQALLRLGGTEQARQAQRQQRTLPWVDSLLQDTRYGLRTLRRSPGFTITAVFTLALGIGACTAIFSLVNAVLIRSLPYGDPERLVYLFTPNPHIPVPADVMTPSYADFYDLKQQSHSFADMTAFEQATFNIALGGLVQRMGAARVDERFFATLQSTPELGRAIGADENRPGHDKVAVISHSLWHSMFAGRADILERSLRLNDTSYRIIGVMPPSFQYPSSSDLPYGVASVKTTHIWIPLALTPKQKMDREPGSDEVIARLHPGVSMRQAQLEMSTIMTRLDTLHTSLKGWGAFIKGFLDSALGPVRPLMWLLLGAVFLVLLIACGNAACLLLARAANRMRELGMRVALGAGRSRIVRQLLTESLLIGLAAGALGVGLAWIFLRILPHLDPGNIPRLNQASLDMRVLLFTVGVSLLTSLLAGVLPALAVSRVSLTGFLASSAGGSAAGTHSRAQSALIVVEAAMVVVLLACSGLLIRSYLNVESVDTGFSPSTVTMNILLDARYAQPEQRRAFFANLIGKIGALPGVNVVGGINYLPLTHSESLGYFWVDGFANHKDQMAEGRSITPQYFSAMNIPLIAGRFFTEGDVSSGSPPTIVNQQFAKVYFANRNPIGGRISTDDNHSQWSTVVGVVADVRHTSLEEAPQPQMYVPDYDAGSIVVRSVLPPFAVVAEIRTTLKSIDPGLGLADIRTMGDLVSEASAQRRFQTTLLTVFAGMALFLAMVGLYGLMAYSVSRRSRELGIRMALGAQRADVLLTVLRKAAFLLCLGLVSGLACSWMATRTIQAFLFGVGAHDPATILLVCLLLAVCGFIAALIPARRAASIDPMHSLRTE
ncbi:MAG: ABC transporter permease [Acidobacteriaceae bacterium]|jgi:predicted permease